jgi:tRNA(fMet)-specific endonuclease VapC
MGGLIYLLDTNVVSEPLATRPNPAVLARIAEHQRTIAISAIGWQEMWYRAMRLPPSRRRSQVEAYLNGSVQGVLPILPFEERAALWQAHERARLAALGRIPPYVDSQIAAVCVVNGLTLVTRNVTDFEHFADLSVENWFEPPGSAPASGTD